MVIAAQLDAWQIGIGLLAAVGSGALGSLIAPWSQHAVATRRARDERRARLVDEWRAMIARVQGKGPGSNTQIHNPAALVSDPAYGSLRPHLDPEERSQIEGPNSPAVRVVVGGGPYVLGVPTLMAAVDRMEKEWKLV
jgi:hypothetical protein